MEVETFLAMECAGGGGGEFTACPSLLAAAAAAAAAESSADDTTLLSRSCPGDRGHLRSSSVAADTQSHTQPELKPIPTTRAVPKRGEALE